MKETFWFKHDYNAHADSKIESLLFDLGWEGYGLFWAILEKLAQETTHQLPTQYERIAFALRTQSDCIQKIVESYNLFIIEDGFFFNNRMMEYFEEREEKTKKAQKSAGNRWKKQNSDDKKTLPQANECERIANAQETQCDGNAIREEERREEERREENIYPKGYSESEDSQTPNSENVFENKNEGQGSPVQGATQSSRVGETSQSSEDSTITLVLDFLKKEIGVADFKESKNTQRAQARNIRDIKNEIGEIEFKRRLENLKADKLKFMNCNSITNLFGELKSSRITPIPAPKAPILPAVRITLLDDTIPERDPEESARIKAELDAKVARLKRASPTRPNILSMQHA